MNPNIDLIYENRKELFPKSFEKFPYLALRAELNRYRESGVPWHWHGAVEIFYMESGELEYTTPGGQMRFPAGSGGFVNSGVLHMTQPVAESQETVQLLHLFEPSLISGPQDGLIMQKFIQPITSRCDLQIIPITNISLLTMLRESFNLDEQTWGYELRLREVLSRLWLEIAKLAPQPEDTSGIAGGNERLQQMLAHIYEHYSERL